MYTGAQRSILYTRYSIVSDLQSFGQLVQVVNTDLNIVKGNLQTHNINISIIQSYIHAHTHTLSFARGFYRLAE